MSSPSDPTFFTSPAELRDWFAAHAADEREVFVGFHKVATGRPTLTWSEAVDEALCVGWIDGITRSLGPDGYVIRFTPRRRGSNWSAVNLAKVEKLTAEGRMQPAGLAAYEARTDKKSGIYSYEQRNQATLDEKAEARFRSDEPAWSFFRAQPPSYRQTAIYWVATAKRPETRERRLETLIADSAAGRRLGQFDRPRKSDDRA